MTVGGVTFHWPSYFLSTLIKSKVLTWKESLHWHISFHGKYIISCLTLGFFGSVAHALCCSEYSLRCWCLKPPWYYFHTSWLFQLQYESWNSMIRAEECLALGLFWPSWPDCVPSGGLLVFIMSRLAVLSLTFPFLWHVTHSKTVRDDQYALIFLLSCSMAIPHPVPSTKTCCSLCDMHYSGDIYEHTVLFF